MGHTDEAQELGVLFWNITKKKGREVPKFDPLIRGGRQEDLFEKCCSGWNQIRHFWRGKKPEIGKKSPNKSFELLQI